MVSRYSVRGREQGRPDAHIADSDTARGALGFARVDNRFAKIAVRDNEAGRDLTLAELQAAARRERRAKLTFGSVLFGLLGFAVGFVTVGFLMLGAVYLFGRMFDRQFVPRGLGFITMPIAGGIGGFAIFSGFVTDANMRRRLGAPFAFVAKQFTPGHFINRICLILAGVWAVAGHFIVSSITEYEIGSLYSFEREKVLLYVWAPVAFLLILPLMIAWARKPPKADKS